MNIFKFTNDTKQNAILLDDILLNKMIIETQQLLSSYLFNIGIIDDRLYKACYINHPCNKWLLESPANFNWLLKQLKDYLIEYQTRFKKEHKNIYNILILYKQNTTAPETEFKGCYGDSGCNNYIDYYQYKKDFIYKRKHKHTIKETK